MVKHLTIVHLYPKEMNIYGDTGNVLVLKKRLQWRDIEAKVKRVGIGDDFPKEVDIIVSGGGQDQGQVNIQKDLAQKAEQIHELVISGVVMLVICGTYQLFGHRFLTKDKREIQGIGVFDLETIASDERLIGNISVQSQWGKLVGYENHSGKTYLRDTSKALGTVLSGAGNNGQDGTEGAVEQNAFGTYLHGPILPKNPKLADELIRRALKRKYIQTDVKELNDTIAHEAAAIAMRRPR